MEANQAGSYSHDLLTGNSVSSQKRAFACGRANVRPNMRQFRPTPVTQAEYRKEASMDPVF
jgi:hypothetical protein